jgi:hypothetical protein
MAIGPGVLLVSPPTMLTSQRFAAWRNPRYNPRTHATLVWCGTISVISEN